MKAYLSKSSDWSFGEDIEVNTLDDLLDLIEAYKESLIINVTDNGELSIEVYDDWRE